MTCDNWVYSVDKTMNGGQFDVDLYGFDPRGSTHQYVQ